MLFIFSSPFTVVLHKHADVFCALTDQQTRSNDIMEDSTDDDDTEPDKQSKKIKQSSKKQSEFTLIKKPAKKMKKTKSKKNQRSKHDELSSLFSSKRLNKTKTGTLPRRLPRRQVYPSHSTQGRLQSTKFLNHLQQHPSSLKILTMSQAERVIKRESNTEFGEEDKIDEALNILVDSDEDNEMEVDVQAKVKTTKIVQGPAVDKDNVQLDGHNIDDQDMELEELEISHQI